MYWERTAKFTYMNAIVKPTNAITSISVPFFMDLLF